MVDARSRKWGMWKRPTFPTEAEARAHADEIEQQILKFGAQPEISNDAKRDAESYAKLKERLSIFHRTPEEAVSHYIEFLGAELLRQAKPTIGQLIDEYEKFKGLEKRDEQYQNEIKLHCKFIRCTWGDRKIDDLRKNEIDTTLTKLKPHKGTRKKYLTHIRMFLNWVIAEDKGYIAINPAFGIKYKADAFSKEHFTANDVKNLFGIVKEIHPELTGYYAVLTFCGLRPSEGGRVTWKHINFDTQQLRVIDESKTGERYIMLEPVAMAWLKFHHEKSDDGKKSFIPEKSLCPQKSKFGYNLFNAEKEVREAYRAKYGEWHSDVLRHTFATHYVSLHKDEPKTAFYMGNSVSIIKKHYAKRLPQSELDTFWNLTPDKI